MILRVDNKSSGLLQVPHSHNQTVVVQNPMTVDESGKLVSRLTLAILPEHFPIICGTYLGLSWQVNNVVVGVTT